MSDAGVQNMRLRGDSASHSSRNAPKHLPTASSSYFSVNASSSANADGSAGPRIHAQIFNHGTQACAIQIPRLGAERPHAPPRYVTLNPACHKSHFNASFWLPNALRAISMSHFDPKHSKRGHEMAVEVARVQDEGTKWRKEQIRFKMRPPNGATARRAPSHQPRGSRRVRPPIVNRL